MQYNALAIFVKTPSLSPVKTRLAKTIGKDQAQHFYDLCLKAVSELATKIDAKPYWAVGEESGLNDECWQNFERLWTGHGGLGERQERVFRALKEYHHNVVLIGADCPQLTPNIVQDGFEKLSSHDYTIGPARDGGYYLFGGSAVLNHQTWTDVEYSLPNTRENLCNKIEGRIYELPLRTDVDEANDLKFLLQEMQEKPTKTQQEIRTWAEEILTLNAA